MPEIAEVARCVHFLRQHIVSRHIKAVVTSADDPIIYQTTKTGLTADLLASTLAGRDVVGAKQQGKYFWLEMDKAPHLLMHLGMTGWIKFRGDEGADYRGMSKRATGDTAEGPGNIKGEGKTGEAQDEEKQSPVASVMNPAEEWPPRFWKFILQMHDGKEAAFVDPRRLGRVRLINVPADDMRKSSPLKENGPDPVIDQHVISLEWFSSALQRKRVPVKSFLLDQSVLSGVGNWVADETLYQARIHPEQYSHSLSKAQVGSLRDALTVVCTTACDLLADSSRFPDDWLMRHRWGKGKKDGDRLPNGEKISFVTVGGRTSAFVATRQRKSGEAVETSKPQGQSNGKRKSGSSADRKPEAKEEARIASNGALSEQRRSGRLTRNGTKKHTTEHTKPDRKKTKT